MKLYKTNEQYFDTIDTEEKAYFLGFIYADGNIHKYMFTIGLNKKDELLLFKLKNFISPTRPIYYCKKRPVVTLCIENKKLSASLKKAGVVERKSLILKFPESEIVPVHLYSHFIRGYFDGDGSIYNLSNRKSVFGLKIISSDSFINTLVNFLKKLNINLRISKCGKVSSAITTKKIEIKKFYDYIYKNSTIHLNRKKNKFNKMIRVTNWERLSKQKTSSTIGVCYVTRENKWWAYSTINKKPHTIGWFNTELEAVAARQDWLGGTLHRKVV